MNAHGPSQSNSRARVPPNHASRQQVRKDFRRSDFPSLTARAGVDGEEASGFWDSVAERCQPPTRPYTQICRSGLVKQSEFGFELSSFTHPCPSVVVCSAKRQQKAKRDGVCILQHPATNVLLCWILTRQIKLGNTTTPSPVPPFPPPPNPLKPACHLVCSIHPVLGPKDRQNMTCRPSRAGGAPSCACASWNLLPHPGRF